MTLAVGSLFAGIGGFDLGLERAGMRVAWQCEINPDARAILAKHWPEVPCYGDIRSINWSDVEPVDLVCGGYPCQPFSHAGSRQGSDDPRHLWPEVARCVRHLRPRWIVLENVAGHLSLGFGAVLGDLAALGYDAWWDCIPAASIGAPHLRDRVFIVAWRVAGNADDGGEPAVTVDDEVARMPRDCGVAADSNDGGHAHKSAHRADRTDVNRHAAHADSGRAVGGSVAGRPCDAGCDWHAGPPVAPVRRMDDGVSAALDAPRLRGLGNAIVPQIPEMIGRVIVELDAVR
jgi:DNA (cytosine-5)-methyltransferase 1